MTHSLAEDTALPIGLLSEPSTAEETLHRSLSLRTVISTTSSLVTRRQVATECGIPQGFRAIGAGTCGTVFDIPGSVQVVKRAKGGWEKQLWNDCVSQKRVLEAFEKHTKLIGDLLVPYVVSFISADDLKFWKEHGQYFPETHRSPAALYITQRIPPLRTHVREALIDKYFPDGLKEKAKGDEANRDCLVRLYLGKRRDPERRKPIRATLMNYNLHLDQMEELELETKDFAKTMARALATIHWEAGLDAEDVEFLLGSAPMITAPTTFSSAELERLGEPTTLAPRFSHGFYGRSVNMWLLDFNRCNKIHMKGVDGEGSTAMQKKGLELAISAFFKNDPYYPRPLSTNAHEQELWDAFRATYLATSSAILSDETDVAIRELPERFILGLMTEATIRQRNKSEAEQRLLERGNWESY
jgi:hypothetical protein